LLETLYKTYEDGSRKDFVFFENSVMLLFYVFVFVDYMFNLQQRILFKEDNARMKIVIAALLDKIHATVLNIVGLYFIFVTEKVQM
jgi:hypothetical protein